MTTRKFQEMVTRFMITHEVQGEISILDNREVNVEGSVFIMHHKQEKLPFQFGRVGGAFHVTLCDNLTSLEGFPHTVGASLVIKANDNLTSLKGFPLSVGYSMSVVHNEKLEHSLENFDHILKCHIYGDQQYDDDFYKAFQRYKTIKDIIT